MTGKNVSTKTIKTATKPKASKCFQSPVKKEEEEEDDSEDDFDIPTLGAPAPASKMEKDEEEEDSDEDEGDWEEVEGLSTSVEFVKGKGVLLTKFKLTKYNLPTYSSPATSCDINLFLCQSELAEPLGPVEPSEPVLPSEPVEIEIETPEIRKRQVA